MSEKTKVYYFKQPKFYRDFHCTGSSCPVNCCFRWGTIGWTRSEYEKLMNAEMSPELRIKTSIAFTPTKAERLKKDFPWTILYNSENKCPLLTEEGLCSIQKELGEEYLSYTCRAYPRVVMYGGNTQNIRTCVTSCTHVMEILCSEEDCMELVDTSARSIELMEKAHNINKEDFKLHPEIKYTDILFDFFYEILSDKTRSIETSFVLGAMAAQKLDELIKKGQANKMPRIISSLKPLLNDPAQIERLEKVKPNLSLKANFAAACLEALKKYSSLAGSVFENGIPNEEKWQQGTNEFNKRYKSYALRNVALNLYLSNAMPFHDLNYSVFDNFRYFTSEFALVKYMAVTSSLMFPDNSEAFEVFVAYADRGFTHTNSAINRNLEIMDKFGITSPAYLMGILK